MLLLLLLFLPGSLNGEEPALPLLLLFLLLSDALLDGIVVVGLVDAECFVQIVVGDRQAEGVFQLHEDVCPGSVVDNLFVGEVEAASVGVDADLGEDVDKVVVEHVEEEPAVGLCYAVLAFFVDGAERLGACFGGFRGESVSEDEFRDFAVAALNEALVDVGASGFVASLEEIEGGVLAVDECGKRAGGAGVGYSPFS